jgi:hypothetical protein
MTGTGRGVGRPGAPYRHRVELLASGVVESCLDEWAAGQGILRSGDWRRVYVKLRPTRSPWAFLVYDADGAPTVQVHVLEPDDSPSLGPDVLHPVGELGRIRILRCEDDPALPGLRSVMACLEDVRVVRCHPGNRCTVRGGRGAGERFVKVLSRAEAHDDQPEVRARWEAARAGQLSFAVAEPHGWDHRTFASWYGVVPGDPVRERIGARAPLELARRVGASLGELAVSSLQPTSTVDATRQLARSARAVGRAAAMAPALAPSLHRVYDGICKAHQRLGPRALVPTHGAASLGQWLVDDTGRLGLIDFDRFAMGDPEFDLATFLVELQAAAKAAPAQELESALLDGFVQVAGSMDDRRFRMYLVHKRLSWASRAATGLALDGEERAARRLEKLEADLRVLLRDGD